MVSEKIAYPKTYVVFDFETTGLDPAKDKIVEVAALMVKDGEQVGTYQSLLNHDIDIPEAASAVHGITRELCAAEGKDPKSVLTELINILNQFPASVTHNGHRFDLPFLRSAMFQTSGLSLGEIETFNRRVLGTNIDTAALFKARKIDVERNWNEPFDSFAARVCEIRAFGVKYNVGACCDDLGIKVDGITLHRAAGDVHLTNEIYKALTR